MSKTTTHKDWRRELDRLAPLALPLLPCGAGAEGKGPIDARTGNGLSRWTTARFTVAEIAAMNGVVRSVGSRTGAGLLCFDIDGSTALELALAEGCDPQQAQTWQVHRDTDPCRLKVLWRLSAEQQSELGAECTSKAHTQAPRQAGEKGEALELFHHPGRQVLLLGQHVPSNGHYVWPDGMGPEALAPIPPLWWSLAKRIAAGELGQQQATTTRSKGTSSSKEWRPADPCPICGRRSGKDRPSSYCGRHRDSGAIRCFHGSTFSPELAHPGRLRKDGDNKVTGSDGVVYGWCGAEAQSNGDVFSTFVVHQEREPLAPRHDSRAMLRSELQDGEAQGPQAPTSAKFTPRPGSTARWGEKRLSHSRAMACFDRCVWVQSAQERNALRRRARLLKAATDLGILKYINRQEIAQRILEAKDRQAGRAFQLLSADDRGRMERPRVEWLIRGLIPANDMSIIGGRPKVGKTRVAIALVRAVLNGESFLDAPEAPPREVILVSDDQADGDTADMLEKLQIWEHPRLHWSRHFRLTEYDLEALLDSIRRYPGALVVIDSLRSISRSLSCKENDPELGALVYDLKEEVIAAGGTLLLIHHCNKADGLVGVEALSGHSSIAGAVNGVLTLHYVEDDKGRPIKDAHQRRLVNEGRSSDGFDVVISRIAGTARFYRVSTWQDWRRAQKEEGEEEKRLGRMSERQKQILEVLHKADAWITRRQVCEAIGVDWGDRGRETEPRNVEKALNRLVELRFAESQRSGTAASYRIASHGAQLVRTKGTEGTTSDANGFRCPPEKGTRGTTSGAPQDRQPLSTLSPSVGDNETPCGDSLADLSTLSGTGSPPALQPAPARIACCVDGEPGWTRAPCPMRGASVLVIHADGRQLAAGRDQISDAPPAPQVGEFEAEFDDFDDFAA